MVFDTLAQIFSSVESRILALNSSTVPHAFSPRLTPSSASIRSYNKNNLRLSSSLQDFSAYSRIDQEEGGQNPNSGTDSLVQTKHHPLLRENGGGLTFSKEKSTPRIPFLRKKWVRVVMVLLCLLLSIFLVYTIKFVFSNWSEEESKFYVILDCGSTGTRVYIYKTSINRQKDGNLPILLESIPEVLHRKRGSQSGRAYNRMETEPGFDKLVRNVTGLKGAIKPLLKWAEKQIPKRSHKNTSLFLYATAGVRRLQQSDSDWLLKNAWLLLKNSAFLCERDSVKIISGMEEAYFGWIALNYETGVFGSRPTEETFGALDLGGSSLQVTFENKDHVHNKTSLKLRIGPVNHLLTAYSLEGYGLNDAFDKTVVHLLKKQPKLKFSDLTSGKVVIKHPCLQSGYRAHYVCSQCASLLEGKISKERKPGIHIKLIGAPKWEECRTLTKIAVNFSEWSSQSGGVRGVDCDLHPCALPKNLPRPSGHFHGMSGFYVVYRFFNLTSDSALNDVLEKGQEFCEKKWDVAKKSVAPQPFIEQYCFRAPYIVYLLREGLHITDSNLAIGSGTITWTLGVALLEAGKAFSNKGVMWGYEIFWMKINPYIIFAIMFVTLTFLVFVISRVGNWTPRFFRRGYLPLFRQNSASSPSAFNIPSPFSFQRWSPINLDCGITGDARVKMPLSPVASPQHRPFGMGDGFSSLQLTESSLYSSSSSNVAHSYSSDNLGQIQFENSTTGSFRSPHRGQMRLQSRRSQSREDLHKFSSLVDF